MTGLEQVAMTGEIEWIDCNEVVPNPIHPREDWDEIDESLQVLAESMRIVGQRFACWVTPIDPVKEAHLAAEGIRYRIIDGHRRFAVAKRTSHRLMVQVHAAALGGSISPVGSLPDLLDIDAGRKLLTTFEVLVAVCRIRDGWPQEFGEEFPESDRLLARLTGCSKSTPNRLRRILDGSSENCRDFAQKQISEGMALKILEIDDPQEQDDAVRRILAENQARSANGKRPVTVVKAEGVIKPSKRKPHLLQAPALKPGVELSVSMRHERDQVTEIVQWFRQGFDLFSEARSAGVSMRRN